MPRLEIKKSDISRVAELAQVCVRAVRSYRDGWPVLRSTAAVIERAVAELPGDAQMELVVIPGRAVAGLSPAGSLGRGSHSSATRAAGPDLVASIAAPAPTSEEIDSALVMGDDISPPARHIGEGKARPAVSVKVPQRCHVTVIGPDGQVMVDEVAL